jgi:single-strand DNA-binding protein
LNKVILVGRVCKEPELKFIKGSGTAVTTFSMAVDRRFKKEGQQEADFINIVIWGKQAEATAKYTTKGKLIGVSGRLEIRSYEAKDGTKRYVTEVIADEVQFIEWADKNERNNSSNQPYYINDVTPIDPDEDILF